MPMVGSTAYNQVSTITALVRALLNDQASNVFTDSVLLPYVNSSYRRVQKKLINTGSTLFKFDNVQLIVPAVPANLIGPGTQVSITDATPAPNQLPSNLLQPIRVRERPNLSTVNFYDVTDMTSHGGLPLIPQGSILGMWEWRVDGLYFIGATQDTQIDLRFVAGLPDLIGPTDFLMIRGAQEAVAYGAAAAAGAARGSPLAAQYATEQDDADDDLILLFIRQQQNYGRRRKPFGSRGGGYTGSRSSSGNW